ncbi:glycine/D-amino acid oxidase, deaminating [Pleurocapsa sp. PCC 7327]|uniref:NAD(P)/FAD-dependent oxidoreductase n=1 Tax=Pleurocapsa sp. PCC 7327 TaxID=118163 RepID=UPI00029FE0E5|nr:FAD-binding oxidoreductase [Pleurocapsa sp. PCC 7327]AFY75639.1 glycine/D-amino acid oxidase, deaminating [Pleurocapsa sp. PCC 7327]
MTNYDWIVIGAGITGSALGYELAKKGFRTLLLEKDARLNNATYYSYGGLAYWSGTTKLTRQICQEGIEIHRNLSEELGADTEFRDIDLMLTIDAQDDPTTVAANYSQFAIAPQVLDVAEACELEPLLNPNAIAGVLRLPHGHIHPHKTNLAYQQAFCRLGGELKIEPVVNLLRQGDRIEGVVTAQNQYYAANTVVCAGGLSRMLLKEAGISIKLYFTHAQLIKTPPVDICLRTLVMPATQKRMLLEAQATAPEIESLWEQPSQDFIAGILDPGAVQFLDGSFYIGQISEIYTNPQVKIDSAISEAQIRTGIATILPLLQNLPGTWHRCLVAFAKNSLPLVGAINHLTGVYLFSGFTSTLVFAPPLARHFASWAAQEKDNIIPQLSAND